MTIKRLSEIINHFADLYPEADLMLHCQDQDGEWSDFDVDRVEFREYENPQLVCVHIVQGDIL